METSSLIDLHGLFDITIGFVGILAAFTFTAALEQAGEWLHLDRQAKTGLERSRSTIDDLARVLGTDANIVLETARIAGDYVSDGPVIPEHAGSSNEDLARLRKIFSRLRSAERRYSAVILAYVATGAFDLTSPADLAMLENARVRWPEFAELDAKTIYERLLRIRTSPPDEAVQQVLDPHRLAAILQEIRAASAASQDSRNRWRLMMFAFLMSGVLALAGLSVLSNAIGHASEIAPDLRILVRHIVQGCCLILGLGFAIVWFVIPLRDYIRVVSRPRRHLGYLACDPMSDLGGESWLSVTW